MKFLPSNFCEQILRGKNLNKHLNGLILKYFDFDLKKQQSNKFVFAKMLILKNFNK